MNQFAFCRVSPEWNQTALVLAGLGVGADISFIHAEYSETHTCCLCVSRVHSFSLPRSVPSNGRATLLIHSSTDGHLHTIFSVRQSQIKLLGILHVSFCLDTGCYFLGPRWRKTCWVIHQVCDGCFNKLFSNNGCTIL